MKWEELPLADRAQLMAAAVRNGYTDIRSIKAAYANFQNQRQQTGNRYDDGGDIDNDDVEVVNVLDEHPVWKALGNIDYETVADPEFTREKTGAGSIEYFSAEEPEGITYNNGYHRDHPMPGKDVILYNPDENDEQDIRLDALHIMPKDPTYDTLNSLYREAARDSDVAWAAEQRYKKDVAKYGKEALDKAGMTPQTYFNNEADAFLRNMFIEGTPEYIESRRYHPNKQQLAEWNQHLMPYVNNIQQYLETGQRPDWLLPELTVTNQNAYGGNLFKTGGNKGKKKGITQQELQRRKNYYRQQLIIRGLRGAQLEAVLANMEVESTFDPGAHNDASGARGLMQWLGSRKPKSWSEKDQLDYIAATYNRFGGNEWLDKKAWKRFNETTDPAEAARLFRRYWERPERGSWNATDALFKNSKGSYLPQDVNDLVAQVSNLQYDEPKAPIFTEEDQRLLDTPALALYNPKYEDTQAPDYKPSALQESIKLDESLWNNPANNWALYNQFANMQQGSSQDDPLGWMTMMASLSPNTTPQQKEAASTIYQLFAPQDGDYSYHGLNFAAYGGRVNRFAGGGRTITIGELPEAYVRAHGNMSVVTPAGNRTTLSDAYKNYNQTPVNTDDVPGLTDYLIKQNQPDISEQAHVDKVAADRELRHRNNIINGPIFDKEKIYNRVPGDMWQAIISDENDQSMGANRGITGSLLGYYFNPDNAVESRLQRYEKYKNLSMKEVMDAGIEFDRMWDKYGLDSIRNNPILSRKMAELESKMRAPYILQHEDAKALYLGLPQRNNTLKDAEYSPTNGNLRNGKYIPYMRDPAFVNGVIMPSYNHLKRNFVDKELIKRGLYKDHSYNMDISLVKEITPRGYARVEFPFLNNATLSGGIDPQRGEYASIFDTWDYNTNTMGTPGDNVGKYIGGEPFDIYDRYYLDDYYGINSKPQDNGYYGGYLPELFIVNKKALGGHLFSDGGFSDLPEQRAYRRAINLKSPYTNYEDAIDMDDSIMLRLKKFFDKGVSNCTLTASQLFNPNNPIGRARTIVNDSINNGFYEIDADHVVPGTMVIASHPNMSDYSPEQNYHTMIVTGFAPNDYEYAFRDGTKYKIKKGEPLVSYSRGKASADNYVHDIPLSVYNANSEGKTYNRYYRPIDEDYPQVMLDNVEIVANKKGEGGNLFPFGGYTNAINAINQTGEGFHYVIDGQKMNRQQALDYINKHKNETYAVNRYSTTSSTAGKQNEEQNWQTLDADGNWIDNNEYHPVEGNLDEVVVTHPYTINNALSQDRTYLQHNPIADLTITPTIDFTNTDQNMFHRRDIANADASVRESISSDVVNNIYDYMMPSTWAGLADKTLEGGYTFNQLFNPTYDNQGWVGLFGADQWAKEHPEEAFAINFGADLLFPYGIKGAKTAVGTAASRLPEVSRNLVASSAINYGAKTRSLPTNIYKQRMLFNVGENGRRRYIHEYNPLADFIDTKRRIPSNTSYFFRSPNNVDILNVHNGSYGAKAQGNVIIGSGSVDGKFVSYGEPWMEFGVNPKLDAWYEFPTMKHRGPHRMATDWRGNRMDYTIQEAYDQMAIRRNPEFQKDYNEFIFKDFNSREEALQAQKDFNEKWGIDPSVNVYDIYHSNQTVIPNKEWNFNSEYPRGFLSQPFWRYTADPYSGAIQKELMMNWPSSSIKSVSNKDILPINNNSLVDKLSEQWDWNRDIALFRGDTQELQRLRDLHFKSAAPNNKYIKSSGMPEEGTHGTNNNFYSFELEGSGIKHGDPGDYGYGHYFYPGNTTSTYGDRQIHAYLNIERPYTGEWNRGFNRGQAGLSQTLKNMRSAREFGLTNLTPEEMIEELNKLKISDGVLAMSPYSGRIQEIVVPTGNQIKLVNPLTFDNNGNLIPLSSRDNFNINDMRFSTGGIMHLK